MVFVSNDVLITIKIEELYIKNEKKKMRNESHKVLLNNYLIYNLKKKQGTYVYLPNP